MVAAAATGGKVTIRNIIPKHLDAITMKLRDMGVLVESNGGDALTVSYVGRPRGTVIRTNPYPGFPTDMQPQFASLLCLSTGVSTITDGIWKNRFKYAEELKKMGAMLDIDDGGIHITGIDRLRGAEVKGSDLRAGAALVIAALAADGVSSVLGLDYIDRGYEDLVGKLRRLGADIRQE